MPTLCSGMTHGNTMPFIIEEERISKQDLERNKLNLVGMMDFTMDHTHESMNRVYDPQGLSPTINTGAGGDRQPKFMEVRELGFMDNGTGKHQSNTVFDTNGICPTITTINGGGTQQIKVLEEKIIYDDYNSNVPKDQDCIGVLGTHCGSGGLRNGKKIIEADNITVKINQATKNGYIDCKIGGVACLDYPTSKLRRGRVIEDGNVSPTIMTGSVPSVIEYGDPDFHNFVYQIGEQFYLIRIRKLTPRECWRLMGFEDEDFEKAEEVNSNTQLYKQAGNSIVVNVLMAIFGQMIPGKEEIYKEVARQSDS